MNGQTDLETRVRRIGTELHRLMGGEVPSLFDRGRWKGRLMEWAMKDEASKVQLFRFIDVLPALKSDALVMRMLDEYFAGLEEAPSLILRGLTRVSRKITLPQIAGKAIRSGVESFGGQFIAGTGPHDVLKPLRRLRDQGITFTLDVLGEAVLSEPEARRYRDRYVELLTVLAPAVASWPKVTTLDEDHCGPIPRLDVSLKVSSFNSQLDPVDWDGSVEGTVAAMGPVLDVAKKLGAGVTLDMEHYYFKDLTIAMFKRMLDAHPDLPRPGIVLQAYLKDTRQDLHALIDWVRRKGLRISLRLVKGAYWDYETVMSAQRGWPCPVFTTKSETDYQFEELTRVLMQHADLVHPAIATHNLRSISYAAGLAESMGLPKEAFEFQTIYGMAEPIRTALQGMGYRVRVYTPVGELLPGMAYLIRRLLENTSNESFLRKSFHDETPLEELIRPPEPSAQPEPSEPSAEGFKNEPLLDFSRTENRRSMKDALDRTRESFGTTYPLYSCGRDVPTDREIVSLNPSYPAEKVGSVARASVADADRAVDYASAAWKSWRRTDPRERAQCLVAAAEWMRSERFNLAAIEVHEVGKTWQEADADVTEAIDFLAYYAREMLLLSAPIRLGDLPGEENSYLYEPKGVGLVISPWNFPLAIPAGMVSAAIVAGNCVLFKPSSLSPICGWKLVEAFRSVGLPPGVLQFLPGDGEEVGEYLVSHPRIHFIAFTGSKAAGLRVIKLAGDAGPDQAHVKSVVAEMGGKNAIIVDETADVDEAVKGIVQSALGFQGQKCSACSRVILVGDVSPDFARRLADAMASTKVGPPEDPSHAMGPLIDAHALAKVRRYTDMASAEGTPLTACQAPDGTGYFVGPALFEGIAPDSVVAQDEIFGPVLAIFRARDIDEALDLANRTPYALTGGIFSRSPGNILKVQREMRVGNLYVNRKITGAFVGRQPFGGFRLSGVGSKAGGPDYLRQFMHPRSICENTMRRGFAPPVKQDRD
ncbi:MAG: proline dehydrogenase family protein [Thermodesulfobacteriota bacterium]